MFWSELGISLFLRVGLCGLQRLRKRCRPHSPTRKRRETPARSRTSPVGIGSTKGWCCSSGPPEAGRKHPDSCSRPCCRSCEASQVHGQEEIHMSPGLNRVLEVAQRKPTSSKTSTSAPSTFLSAGDGKRLRPLPALAVARCHQRRDSQSARFDSWQSENHRPKSRREVSGSSTYSRDLTELARKGKLDPVIGRDDEIRRTIQVCPAEQRTIRY